MIRLELCWVPRFEFTWKLDSDKIKSHVESQIGGVIAIYVAIYVGLLYGVRSIKSVREDDGDPRDIQETRKKRKR